MWHCKKCGGKVVALYDYDNVSENTYVCKECWNSSDTLEEVAEWVDENIITDEEIERILF